MLGYSSTRCLTLLAHVLCVLVVLGGCIETPDPRISSIEGFEPQELMKLAGVQDALGTPDFLETVEEAGEEYDTFTADEVRVGYGPFPARTSAGDHTTKYRLNLVFEKRMPGPAWRKDFLEAMDTKDKERQDILSDLSRDFSVGIPRLSKWYRESPE